MPSWSARNNPLSNPSNNQHSHHHFASPPSQSHLHPSIPRALPQDVPVLPSRPVASNPMLAMASSSASSPRQRRGHTRSISHPFNGVLSGRGVGKKHSRAISKDVLMDSDDDDDANPYEFTFTPMPLASSPKKQLPRTPPADGTEDFATGKCLTCSTMVRWPKNLSTFRCTECLMINDLEVPGDNGKPAVPRKAIPISFDRTKGIIDNCIASYLRKLLEAPETRPLPIKTPSGSRLGQSPNRGNGYLSDCSSGDPQSRTPSGPNSPTKPKPDAGASSYPTTSNSQTLFPPSQGPPPPRGRSNSDMQGSQKPDRAKPFVSEPKEPAKPNRPTLFRPVEDYIVSSFKACDCLNVSFSTAQQPPQSGRDASPTKPMPDTPCGTKLPPKGPSRPPELGNGHSREKSIGSTRPVTSRSPRINWAELAQWYHLMLTAGASWVELWSAMQPADVYKEEDALRKKRWDSVDLTAVDRKITDARFHLQRTLLKATENLLKRPRQPLKRPEDTRFLLMLLANPMLYPSSSLPGVQAAAVTPHKDKLEPPNTRDRDRLVSPNGKPPRKEPTKQRSRGPGGHSGIIKRIMGLISTLPVELHHYLISWFSRFSVGQFERIVDLVGSFFTYRLTRQHGRKQNESFRTDDSLIPSFSSAAGNTPAELHAAINGRNQSKSNKNEEKPTVYGDDWQILAACRVMSLLFSANNAGGQRKPDEDLDDPARRNQVINRGHLIPISSFYNTLLDYSDLVADFEGWESKTSRFSFCQYPFFLSIWAKIHILEHDARRQMEVRAREAFFSSILSRKAVSQYLVLKVRRDCLVEDSLKRISEVVWNSQQEIKKGLRVEFLGEEGVDAGGLRKEWFLLLVRDVFDPNHGLFIYDEDSQYCYFNPFCFESSEQFFLVGVLLGLAIYNSTILDIALPPFAFRKLLAAAPQQQNGPSSSTTAPRTGFKSTLDDLAEYRPALAKGLRSLLEFEGDVAETFCYDFVAQLDRYGERVAVPLCEGGEKRPVTNANRREFVDLYVQQILDVSVMRQFQPFKRGFFTVCGGNALSLFRSEEIELLVRGSDEPLDVPSLKAVATYDNWPNAQPESEPVVQWFWEFFQNTQPAAQRKILSFITGSDRIPAMGATSLCIRLTCLGDDTSRYPTARTCFNMLGLYRYPTRERLEQVLWEAVVNGEGFGLK